MSITAVRPSTWWSLTGSTGTTRVRVIDVVDGPQSTVIYELTDNYNDRARGMMGEAEFLRRFEEALQDPRI